MDSIRDLTWAKHLRTGTVVERMDLGAYRVVSIRASTAEKSAPNQYVYRMLFFPASSHRPVLALNLEHSILGSFCLTEQAGTRHTRFDWAGDGMGYPEFREWALARAAQQLDALAAVARVAG
jgi:hypothetical protein